MEQQQQQMVQEIVDFVTRNSQSHASRIVCQTALGDYHAQVNLQSREELLKNLQEIGYEDLEYCYYLIK
ncbi:MAG: hypothetical protein Q7I94_07565 [Candidatus Contubernalis sp.]|nr:hypothetical protein [Candidatus Contubernalis sp.]